MFSRVAYIAYWQADIAVLYCPHEYNCRLLHNTRGKGAL
jgi:hypothetical protein